jgi:hypothetical protein
MMIARRHVGKAVISLLPKPPNVFHFCLNPVTRESIYAEDLSINSFYIILILDVARLS